MKTLGNGAVRHDVLARVKRLNPDSRPLWGRMSVHEMVRHLSDSFLVGLGEKAVPAETGLLRRTVHKWLALYAPFPAPLCLSETAETPSIVAPAADFESDLTRLRVVIARFCGGCGRFKDSWHPTFSLMLEPEWLRWGYLHADHHLRQFGV